MLVCILQCAVASAVEQEAKRPPQDGDHVHQDYHGNHNPNFPVEDTKTNDLTREQNYHGLNNPNFPINSEEDRKFYKPYFIHPYFHHPLHNPHPAPESPETEEVADSTEASSIDDESQQSPSEPYDSNQEETIPEENEESDTGNTIEEIDQTGEEVAETSTDDAVPFDDVESRIESMKSYEVECDFLSVPRYSCYSCYTYLVCKPGGGKVKSCSDANAPYCNNGVCSANPSAECTQNSSALFS